MKARELLARELLGFAIEFHCAGMRLAKTTPFLSHPTCYLTIHALELGMKAHLAIAGVTKKKLSSRSLGHSLAGLLDEAKQRKIHTSLGLSAHDRKQIALGSRHYAGKCFEYPELYHSTFPIGIWLRWTKRVIDALPTI